MSTPKSRRNFAVIQQLHLQKSASATALPQATGSTVDGNDHSSLEEKSLGSSKSASSVTAALANENKNALWLAKRPVLKAFLHHAIMLLELLPFSDYDAYIRELQATIEDCLGAQRYKRAAQAAHQIQQNRRNAVLALSETESTSHSSVYASIVDIEDRTAAEGAKFFWEDENLRNDDVQLKSLLHELATQTCHARSVLQVEAKLDRLIEGYFTLRVRTHRSTIAHVIGHSHMTDPQRCIQFFDLFAINYFNSETFSQFHNRTHPALAHHANSAHHHHSSNSGGQSSVFLTSAAHPPSSNGLPPGAPPVLQSSLSPQKRRESHVNLLLKTKAIV